MMTRASLLASEVGRILRNVGRLVRHSWYHRVMTAITVVTVALVVAAGVVLGDDRPGALAAVLVVLIGVQFTVTSLLGRAYDLARRRRAEAEAEEDD